MIKKLLLCPILILIGSCAATPIDLAIGVIPRPHLMPLTVEMQQRIPVDALDIIAVNQEVLKNHIKRYEQRIILHDESL